MPMMAIPAIPPTIPPTIGPTGVEFAIAVGTLLDVVVEEGTLRVVKEGTPRVVEEDTLLVVSSPELPLSAMKSMLK